jgi:hypothetical protein
VILLDGHKQSISYNIKSHLMCAQIMYSCSEVTVDFSSVYFSVSLLCTRTVLAVEDVDAMVPHISLRRFGDDLECFCENI